MRLLIVLLVVGAMLGVPGVPARAAPVGSCPTRNEVIDSLQGTVALSDFWLILSFGSLVGLAGSAWGPPAGVAVSLAVAGVSAASGLGAVGLIDQAVRDNLPEMANRLQRAPDDLYDQVHYGEEVVTGNWLMRVAGATVGSIVGLLAPLGVGPLRVGPLGGVGGSVVIGSAGGVALGGLWHRFAVWPFADDLPELCRAAGATRI